MSKRKINSGLCSSNSNVSKHINKSFPEGYKNVFYQPLFCKSDIITENYYLPDTALERSLASFINSNENLFAYLIGYTGIGKSTVLKHYFHYEGREIILKNNSIFYTKYTWDYSTLIDNTHRIRLLFHSLNSLLASEAELNAPDNMTALLKNLRFNHSDLIEHDNTKDCSSLEQFRRYNEHTYEIRQFQYLLQQRKIHSFVIVLDNIEDIAEDKRHSLLGQLLDAYKMLTDWKSFGENDRPLVKFLLSSRPDTYFKLCGFLKCQDIMIDFFIKKTAVLNMDKYYSLKIKSLPQKRYSQWADSIPYFLKVSQKFNGKYNQIILGLSNYNINTAMKLYASVLSNETWAHSYGDSNTDGVAYYFDSSNLLVNNITVIRALACQEDEMFLGQNDTPFCNLLYSTKEEDYSILVLYIMKRFHMLCGTEHDYGSIYLKKWQVIKQFSEIFCGIDQIENKTEKCIQYLYNADILANNSVTESENSCILEENSHLYLTPRGTTIWEMLTMDSVLLELFREDYYRIYQNNDNNPFCSKTLLMNQQHELFLDLIRMVKEISILEKEYYQSTIANGTITVFKHYFGNHSVCHHLLSGVLKSMTYSGIYNNPVVKASYEALINDLW